jgi:broad specificity phosphatase PhoE
VAEKLSLAIYEKLAIREIDFGSWDGLTFAEVDAQYNGAASLWFRDPLHRFPVNGETLPAVFERVSAFADSSLAPLVSEDCVIVVAHFGSLAMLTAWLLNVDLDQALKIVLQRGQCGLIQAGHLRWWGLPHV